MKALVIICAYNEGVKLEKTGERIRSALEKRKCEPTIDVLVADDGSTDGAPEAVAAKCGFLLFRNAERKGIGHLIRGAYRYGLERGYEILVTMAANNKDNPEEFDRIIGPVFEDKADFIQGSRYLPGGNFGNMPLYRVLTTRYVHPMLFSFVSGRCVTDSTNGFRAVHAKVLRDEHIHLDQDWLDRYELEPYLFYYAVKLGYRVTEVPVTKIYPVKGLGYSKMKPITGWWSMLKPMVFLFFRIKR